MTAADRLAEIEARANAATEGPWEACCYDSGHSRFEMACSVITADVGDTIVQLDALLRLDNERHAKDDGRADAEFIARARQDVPALVSALRAVLDLHRPSPRWTLMAPEVIQICEPCSNGSHAVSGAVVHPCPTVAAIAAALDPS